MYDELINRLRGHQCDAGEDDTQDFCEECQYDVIVADKSTFSGIRKVCVCGLINEAADAIEELSKQHEAQAQNIIALLNEKPRWIPVTERLPELAFVNEWYLVALESGCVESLGYTKGKGWFPTGSPVTHWMPLPEPPKEEP